MLHLHCLWPERFERTALWVPGMPLRISYGALANASGELARLLADAGVAHGSRVALLLPSSPDLVVCLLSVWRCGGAAAPIDTSLRGTSLHAVLEGLRPDAVIATPGALRRALQYVNAPRIAIALEETRAEPDAAILAMVHHGDRARPFHLGLTPDPAVPLTRPGGLEPSDQDALLISTSGSTGRPKCVRLGHAGTLANTRGHLASFGLEGQFRALHVLDAPYSYGLVSSLLAPLVAGGTVVFPPDSSACAIREAIVATRPDVCLATPALLEYLIDACPPEERAVFGRISKIGIGGDHCRPSLRRKIKAFMPQVEAYATYGATEAGPRIATLPAEEFLSRPGAVGLPLDGVELAVTDPEGKPCDAGEVGLLHVRTPSRMNGYLHEEASLGGDGWLSLGDLADIDRDGYLTIHGRLDREFKHRGRRINPAQIERVIEDYPGVVSAYVEHVKKQGHLRAVVHHRPGQPSDLVSRLRQHCRRNLPGRLVPGEIAAVVEHEGYFFKGRRLSRSENSVFPFSGERSQ